MPSANVTHAQLMDFARRLGEAEYRSKLNYFRIMEYPLSLNLLDARAGMRVLDIGSGFISLPPLWWAAAGCEVVAVDKQRCDDETRAHIAGLLRGIDVPPTRLEIVAADAQSLPYPDNHFDRVSAISALEHFATFTDSATVHELARVLKVGGRMVISVPFNLGRHIECEKWGGEEYEQRHYTDDTLRERLIDPTGLHFAGAIAYGEVDPEVGKRYIAMDAAGKRAFAEKAGREPSRYWTEYYRVEGEQFIVHRPLLPPEILPKAGIIAVALEKRDAPLPTSFFPYDPLRSWEYNQHLTRSADNSAYWLTVDAVRLLDERGRVTDTVDSGSVLRVQIDFTARGAVVDPVFRVIFHDMQQRVVTTLCVGDETPLGRFTGKASIEVTLESVNLAGGPYEVTVGAWDRPRPDPLPPAAYDVHLRRYRVHVDPRRRGYEGHVYLPHRVAVKKATD